MSGSGTAISREDDASLVTRAAWLHYVGGLTQADVAKRLGLTSLKAHRLITRANQDGIVKVHIDGAVSECVALESALLRQFGLDYCEVVPRFDFDDLPLRALGIAGGQFLKREIERGSTAPVGVGHGRTLAACVDCLPRTAAQNMRFVSLLGGLTRKFSANPHDVIHRLAERTGAEAYVVPVPMFANTVEDRAVLYGQKGVAEVFELARSAELFFAGIGTVEREASLVATGMVEKSEMDEIKALGGVGELLGHFFDETGQTVECSLTNRVLSLARADLDNRRIVAVAGGRIKVSAILSVLRSGTLSGLITEEETAHALMKH